MLVRLHGGPGHGKKLMVPDHQTDILYQFIPKNTFTATFVSGSTMSFGPYTTTGQSIYPYPTTAISSKAERYELRLLTCTINGRTFTAPQMNPDGSITFFHEKFKVDKK